MDPKSAAQSEAASGIPGSATQVGEIHVDLRPTHLFEFPASHITQPSQNTLRYASHAFRKEYINFRVCSSAETSSNCSVTTCTKIIDPICFKAGSGKTKESYQTDLKRLIISNPRCEYQQERDIAAKIRSL